MVSSTELASILDNINRKTIIFSRVFCKQDYYTQHLDAFLKPAVLAS